ncbi:hypothetical protein EUGRSUZ_A02207 [Eucalyptus grandis]|uniref:Uncharacterized protein n=2 Tax=Eucalyptus grandis TaxID=71139 RepID=A0ACC3M6I6_EUCGR|nr:hypothetical protein EUGRSUZ_A02207 [Eucalyptus grandis]
MWSPHNPADQHGVRCSSPRGAHPTPQAPHATAHVWSLPVPLPHRPVPLSLSLPITPSRSETRRSSSVTDRRGTPTLWFTP